MPNMSRNMAQGVLDQLPTLGVREDYPTNKFRAEFLHALGPDTGTKICDGSCATIGSGGSETSAEDEALSEIDRLLYADSGDALPSQYAFYAALLKVEQNNQSYYGVIGVHSNDPSQIDLDQMMIDIFNAWGANYSDAEFMRANQ